MAALLFEQVEFWCGQLPRENQSVEITQPDSLPRERPHEIDISRLHDDEIRRKVERVSVLKQAVHQMGKIGIYSLKKGIIVSRIHDEGDISAAGEPHPLAADVSPVTAHAPDEFELLKLPQA
ncbi:hypothetical protein [uncultured Victivallis sp.]|uniref:hypothetical protein n=1 Tax=uncultured Victivallis sp. TaxID=354118 RepID=UPI0025FD7443|nr:hypothetical protein [uncultured Victivallis sp.]